MEMGGVSGAPIAFFRAMGPGLFVGVPVVSSDATGGGPAEQHLEAEIIFRLRLTLTSYLLGAEDSSLMIR
jgi:hypothetical protein